MKALHQCIRGFFLVLFLFDFLVLGAHIQRIESEQDLPEEFCTLWEEGDYIIEFGENLALIGGTSRQLYSVLNYPAADAKGNILSLVPSDRGLTSDLIIGSPFIEFGRERHMIDYTILSHRKTGSSGEGMEFLAQAEFKDQRNLRAAIQTVYQFLPEKRGVRITSTLSNTGQETFQEFNYFLYLSAQHKYGFSPFHQELNPELDFRIFQKKGHYVGWVNLNESDRNDSTSSQYLAPGEEAEVQYLLLTDTDGSRLLKNIYEIIGRETEILTLSFKDPDGGLMEVIVQDAFSSSVYFRSFMENPHFIQIPLPTGVYEATCHFFPATVSKLVKVVENAENEYEVQDVAKGTVKVRIKDKSNKFVPGKVTFIGLFPTRSPYFAPEDPCKTGRYWESFKNSCYPPEKGQEVILPVGTYLVYASRGPEYSMEKLVIEVLKRQTQDLTFHIDKIIETPGLVSADTHMHTLKSDGRVRISERIKSVVAEGVDVAVATDHNYVTDYQPVLKKMGYEDYLDVMIGNEISTGGVIHYNSYPLQFRGGEENNGAINPVSEEVSPLFEASREKDPQSIIQVNHPRSGTIGYFNNYHLDPESAASARENFDLSFDVLEVLNGPYYYSSNYQSIHDWLHLLNRGYYFPIVASSDAHGIDRGEPGYSRTYVICEDKDKETLEEGVLLERIKKGHSFLSNGPIVDLQVNKKAVPGETLSLKDGRVKVSLNIKCAPWFNVDEARIIVNGKRKIIIPLIDNKDKVHRYSEEVSFNLEEDAYIVLEVLGDQTLYPVLQRPASGGLRDYATFPYALTNPVFIDVNGNDRFDPPLPDKIEFISYSSDKR